ncbi:hypothetical protein E2562_033464, partial [Oryza meyeriana var. granulata]
ITDGDHYGRLGITRLASTDEVEAAYEKKCEELNSKGLEEEEINKEHDLLKESFTILSTEEERRLYDWSLARSGQPERYIWPFEVDPMELAPDPPKEPEDEFPTKLKLLLGSRGQRNERKHKFTGEGDKLSRELGLAVDVVTEGSMAAAAGRATGNNGLVGVEDGGSQRSAEQKPLPPTGREGNRQEMHRSPAKDLGRRGEGVRRRSEGSPMGSTTVAAQVEKPVGHHGAGGGARRARPLAAAS